MPARSSARRQTGAGRVPHFDADRFDKLGRDHGVSAHWWRANLCPCRGHRSSAPNMDCPRCHGWGWYWYGEQTIKLSALSDNTRRILDTFGSYAPGDIMASMPTHQDGTRILATIKDRFYFPTRIEPHVQRLRRGEIRDNGATMERIWSPAVSRVHACATVSTDFVRGTDYQIDDDERGNGTIISWLPSGSGPADGEEYSISFEAAMFYHLEPGATAKYRVEDDQRMPQQIRLTKKWTPSDMEMIAWDVDSGQGEVP